MTKLAQHQSSQTTKLLLIGDSGSGKTGALASLASEGYNLWLVDLDNGIDVLKNILLAEKSPYKRDAIDRVHFRTITDPMKQSGGKLIPVKATAWQRMSKLLSGEEPWQEEPEPGPITKLGPGDVLVIDSLSAASKAALNFVLNMNARLGQRPHQSDWGDGQAMIETLLQTLYDENVTCNVIVIAHITFSDEARGGSQKGYPKTLGKALNSVVGTYFNSTLQVLTEGFGSQQKKTILTKTSSVVELKNSSPFKVKDKYDISFGLAEYFKDVRLGAAATPIPTPTAAATGPSPAANPGPKLATSN